MTFNSSGQPIGRPEQLMTGHNLDPQAIAMIHAPGAPQTTGASQTTGSLGGQIQTEPIMRSGSPGDRDPLGDRNFSGGRPQLAGPFSDRNPSGNGGLQAARPNRSLSSAGPPGIRGPLGDLNSAGDRTEPGPLKRPDRGPSAPQMSG